MEINMRIRNIINEVDHGDLDLQATYNNDKKEENDLIKKIKDVLKTLKVKLKIDEPGGDDDLDHEDNAKAVGNIVNPITDPSEKNVQIKSNLPMSPAEAVEMYNIGKPYDKFRLWNPTEDKDGFMKYIADKLKRALGMDIPKKTIMAALESVEVKKDVSVLYEHFMFERSGKKGQTIKLKELLK